MASEDDAHRVIRNGESTWDAFKNTLGDNPAFNLVAASQLLPKVVKEDRVDLLGGADEGWLRRFPGGKAGRRYELKPLDLVEIARVMRVHHPEYEHTDRFIKAMHDADGNPPDLLWRVDDLITKQLSQNPNDVDAQKPWEVLRINEAQWRQF